jgi:hypothetical protein
MYYKNRGQWINLSCLPLSDISAEIKTIQQSLIYIKVNEVLEKPATIENIIGY